MWPSVVVVWTLTTHFMTEPSRQSYRLSDGPRGQTSNKKGKRGLFLEQCLSSKGCINSSWINRIVEYISCSHFNNCFSLSCCFCMFMAIWHCWMLCIHYSLPYPSDKFKAVSTHVSLWAHQLIWCFQLPVVACRQINIIIIMCLLYDINQSLRTMIVIIHPSIKAKVCQFYCQ